MLYTVIAFELPTPGGDPVRDTIPSGQLGVIPFTVASGGHIVLTMNQLIADPDHRPQDFSMRGWISNQQGGNPVIDSPAADANFNITAMQKRIVVVYDLLSDAPATEGINIGVLPGSYWLNILNLVNEPNSFALEIIGG
jgi:hypothetical protein